ncbi:MAG: hypothetical protein AB1627_03250 [Chloroflexota bacterium]
MRRLTLMLIALVIAACGGPAPSSTPAPTPSASAAVASATDIEGRFVLTFELPRTTFTTADAITATATLGTTDGLDAGIVASGGGPLGFSFTEVGGTRRMGFAMTADCVRYTVGAEAPITSGIRKSGGWGAEDPNAAFYEQFFADPEVHLPPGTWDITAVASFAEGTCGGVERNLTATIRVTVNP